MHALSITQSASQTHSGVVVRIGAEVGVWVTGGGGRVGRVGVVVTESNCHKL